MPPESNVILKAYTLFEQYGLQPILIGGAAVILHGSSYVTQDIDFCFQREPDALENLASALNTIRPRFRVEGIPEGVAVRVDRRTLQAGSAFSFITTLGNLDVRFSVDGIGNYDDVAALSETLRVGDHPLSILSLDGLIQSKAHLNRPRDQLVLPELRMMKEAKTLHERSNAIRNDSVARDIGHNLDLDNSERDTR